MKFKGKKKRQYNESLSKSLINACLIKFRVPEGGLRYLGGLWNWVQSNIDIYPQANTLGLTEQTTVDGMRSNRLVRDVGSFPWKQLVKVAGLKAGSCSLLLRENRSKLGNEVNRSLFISGLNGPFCCHSSAQWEEELVCVSQHKIQNHNKSCGELS